MLVSLVADRDDRLVELVAALDRHGARTRRIAPSDVTRMVTNRSDVILLDSSLPYDAGIVLCRKIRSMCDVPIVMISERAAHADRIQGLRAGADYYVSPPCYLDELIASLFAASRPRGQMNDHGSRKLGNGRVGDIELDVERMRVAVGGVTIELTKKEFQLLAVIFGEDGGVCPREKLAAAVWGLPEEQVRDSIQVLMSRLRAKLGHDRIRTERSVGYRLAARPADQEILPR